MKANGAGIKRVDYRLFIVFTLMPWTHFCHSEKSPLVFLCLFVRDSFLSVAHFILLRLFAAAVFLPSPQIYIGNEIVTRIRNLQRTRSMLNRL